MLRRSGPGQLRRRDKVIAVEPIKDIPEGALGEVKMVVGQAWTRYLVRWENGEWTGTVDGSKIVRRDRLDEWRAEQERKATTAATTTQAAAAGPAEAVSASGVPEHLLERSRTARARWEAKQAG